MNCVKLCSNFRFTVENKVGGLLKICSLHKIEIQWKYKFAFNNDFKKNMKLKFFQA